MWESGIVNLVCDWVIGWVVVGYMGGGCLFFNSSVSVMFLVFGSRVVGGLDEIGELLSFMFMMMCVMILLSDGEMLEIK